MNDSLQSLVSLFKKDQISKYVAEREIAQYMGNDVTVQIVDKKKNISSKSFCIFVLPEKQTQGFNITLIIDSTAIKNIYSDEDFIVVLERLKSKKQKFFKRYNDFLKEKDDTEISLNYALGFILDLYSFYRSDLSVRNGDYLPDDDNVIKYAELFTTENGKHQDIEKMLIEEIICTEILDFAKKYVGINSKEIKFGSEDDDSPSYNEQYQKLIKTSTSTFGTRNHKEIPYNYLPKTNQ